MNPALPKNIELNNSREGLGFRKEGRGEQV